MSNWKKRILKLMVTVPMLAMVIPATSAAAETAQDASAISAKASASDNLDLLASYDFTGGSVKDTVGSYDMTLKNGASVGAFGDRNQNEALNLDNASSTQKYAEIPSSLFAGIGNEATIDFAAKSRHSDDGNYFTFTVGKDSTHYLFFYLSTASAKLVISDNAWNNEHGFKDNLTNVNGTWHNYRIIIKDDQLALLQDGELVDYESDTGITLADLGRYNTYIGKSFYANDKYWNGAMDDLKIYKGANIKLPTAVTISGDGVVDNTLSLVENDTAQLSASVEPEDALSTDVTWTSGDSSIAKVDASGKVTAVKSGETTISATAKTGNVKAVLPVKVTPLSADTSVQIDLDSAISALKTTTDENLPLISTGTKHGSDIVWTSSEPTLISSTDADYQAPANGASNPYKGAGITNRPNYGEGDSKPITLTATASKDGVTKSASVDVVLKEKTRTAPNTGYAAVTFLSDSNTSGGKIGEALYESATSAEKSDFFSFSEINDGNPVITSTTDTTGLRDPFVLKSHDGDKYYMIATDLKVSQQGWGLNQQYGSLKVEVWESKDMVNWTRTNAEDGDTGITVNSANQGMTWAPEAFWDDSIGAYVVFFSSRAYADDSRSAAVTSTATGNAYNIVRYAITRDFKTFTAAQDWQNTQYSRIDSTVFKIGDYYYRLTKNEESGAAGNYVTTGKTTFLERSKCLTCTTSSSDPDADESTTWRLLDENILPFEGPESIKLNADDVNQNDDGDAMVIMADSSGYKPFMTSQRALSETNWSNRLSQTDGWFEQKAPGANVTGRVNDSGMPTPTRHGAFVNVPQTVLEAMHSTKDGVTGTIQAVDSNTKATYESKTRRISASVTAADDGNVAGSVTFTADDWSQTVALDTHGVAHIVVPDGVSGTVSISYDGYTDGLVNPSQAMVEGIEAVDGAPTQPSLKLLSDGKEISRLTMRVGDVKELVGELSAENADGQSVQWSTSDSDIVALIERDSQSRSIATSKQNIKAVKPGTATITLTAADSDISASVEITVMDDQAGTHPESPTKIGNDKNPESPLADTGTAIVSVCAAAALLALAGVGTLLWRRRRTQHR